jgi:hypothetical protein
LVLTARALACAAALALAAAPAARSAAPAGFSPPRVVGANLEIRAVTAADAGSGPYAAVAFADQSGGVWATRVRTDGTLGSPLPAGARQDDVRDLRVAVTERGEIVVVWAAFAGRDRPSVVRDAVAPPGRSFAGAHTLATVGSNTSATPRIAALRGGTVAVVLRDTRSGVLRYARRAPGGSFGTARSLGHDGISPEIEASPGGGALLAWARGPLIRRSLEVASAQRGATLPGSGVSVAGNIRALALSASADGTAWVTWTRRDSRGRSTGFARRTRAANRAAVGPVQELGTVAYGVPHVALGASQQVLAAWNAVVPDASGNVRLAAAQGTAASLNAPVTFDAGGFSPTSPMPALLGATPLVLFTRDSTTPSGATAEAVVADPVSGDGTALGGAGTIAPPAVAHVGDGVAAAWAVAGGGVAVSFGR